MSGHWGAWSGATYNEDSSFATVGGVKKSGFSVFLVSVENGAGVNKMTNITYVGWLVFDEQILNKTKNSAA